MGSDFERLLEMAQQMAVGRVKQSAKRGGATKVVAFSSKECYSFLTLFLAARALFRET
jgi:hypothetical protein